MKFFLYTLFLLSCVSCSTKFNQEQIAALSSVRIVQPKVDPSAYREPNGGMPTTGQPTTVVPGSAAAGAVGGMLGQLMIEGISGKQNQMFKDKHKDSFLKLQANVPQIAPLVYSALEDQLMESSFFKERLSSRGEGFIETEVITYGLVRTGKKDDEILLSPSVACRFTLKDTSGKTLLTQVRSGISESHPLSWYLESRINSKNAYDSSAKMASRFFTDDIKNRVAP